MVIRVRIIYRYIGLRLRIQLTRSNSKSACFCLYVNDAAAAFQANFDELLARKIACGEAKAARNATTVAGATAAAQLFGVGHNDPNFHDAVAGERDGEDDEEEEKGRAHEGDEGGASLEAAVNYLFANNPQSLNTDTIESLTDRDADDREMQMAISLSLQETSALQ